MPPKKKNKANAFSMFIYDQMDKRRMHMSFQQAVVQLTPKWKTMGKEEKEKYEQMARLENGKLKKYTSEGIPIEEIERKEEMAKQEETEMKIGTEQLISNAISSNTIKDKYFYIIHMFYYCYRHKKYYPAEIGVCKFNLKNGIDKIFHAIIHPGELPLGSAYDAIEKSKDTHQLPLPDENKPSNVDKVFYDLKKFVMEGNNKVPPLLTRDFSEIECTTKTIKTIFEYFNSTDIKYRFYNLDYFFFLLKQNFVDPQLPSTSIATVTLNRDIFQFTSDLSCEYHQNTDVPEKCSYSIAGRCAFMICDHICKFLGITLIPGKHVPDSASVNCNSKPPSVACTISSSRFNTKYNTKPKSEENFSDFESSVSRLNFIQSDTETEGDVDFEWGQQRWQKRAQKMRPQSPILNDMLSQSTTCSTRTQESSKCLTPGRRPLTSSEFMKNISFDTLSLSQNLQDESDEWPSLSRIGKGRGRGIARK